MTTINLRKFYYWYPHDEFLEVTDEVAEALRAGKRSVSSQRRRVTRNKAQYSLDCDDGIEYSVCQHEPSPHELLERVELFYHLWNALNTLPEVQGRRVDAHLILGKSYQEIADAEGVNKYAVECSVQCGLKNMKNYLKKYL